MLAGAGGVAIGWTWADPAVGLLITAAILVVGWQAAREVGRRLMDSVDPALTDAAEATLLGTPGVLGVGQLRLRWVGHRLRAECEIGVDPNSSVVQAHDIAVGAEHAVSQSISQPAATLVDDFAPARICRVQAFQNFALPLRAAAIQNGSQGALLNFRLHGVERRPQRAIRAEQLAVTRAAQRRLSVFRCPKPGKVLSRAPFRDCASTSCPSRYSNAHGHRGYGTGCHRAQGHRLFSKVDHWPMQIRASSYQRLRYLEDLAIPK